MLVPKLPRRASVSSSKAARVSMMRTRVARLGIALFIVRDEFRRLLKILFVERMRHLAREVTMTVFCILSLMTLPNAPCGVRAGASPIPACRDAAVPAAWLLLKFRFQLF